MAKQRLKKMVITVTPQTAYHLKDRFFCRRNRICFEACSECDVHGECFMCISCGDTGKCSGCTRYYEETGERDGDG